MVQERRFLPDDIERIQRKYFDGLRGKGEVAADPSFWFNNHSEVAQRAEYAGVRHYRSDYSGGLSSEKAIVTDAISRWDEQPYGADNLTFCSSATTGSLAVLAYIKGELGIDRVLFETPSYFASVKQAQYLSFETILLPTYIGEGFQSPLNELFSYSSPKAIWLTQPRYGIGQNYDIARVQDILARLSPKDVVVIDEATEQMFPSHLSEVSVLDDPRIFKIRSPFKGLGINGPRLSILAHHARHTQKLRIARENTQGSIDAFSLGFATELFSKSDYFFDLLRVANSQIQKLHQSLQTQCLGTTLELSSMQNGYIGSVGVDLGTSSLPYFRKRERLLQFCARERMPVILGATMNFAIDPRLEFVRLSYFAKEQDLKKAIKILSTFVPANV